MKHNLRNKFFYVLMIALMAVVAIGATPATPVNAAACFLTTTGVVGPVGPAVYGTPAVFTATVLPVGATGTVQFMDGAVALGGPIALPAGGVVVANIDYLDVNLGVAHPITAVYSGDANYCTSNSSLAPVNYVVAPLGIITDGNEVAVGTKVYDGTTVGSFIGGDIAAGQVLFGDDVSIATRAGVYDFATVAAAAWLTPAFTLGGADAGNYAFVPGAAQAAVITPKPLAVTGVTASNKVYDALSTATVNTTGATFSLGEVLPGDAVDLTKIGITANFVDAVWAFDKTIGIGKTVEIFGFGLAGVDAGNYALQTHITTTADITPRHLTLFAGQEDGNLVANNKPYDGNTDATFGLPPAVNPLTPVQGGDAVTLNGTGSFADANVGTGIAVTPGVFDLTGADAGNYVLDQQPVGAYTANITGPVNTTTYVVTNPNNNFTGSPIAAVLEARLAGGYAVPGTFSNIKYNGLATVPSALGVYAITADFTPNNLANVNAPAAGLAYGNMNIIINPVLRTEMLQNGGFNDYGYADKLSLTQLFIPSQWFDIHYAEIDGRSTDAYEGAFSVVVHGEKGVNRSKSLFQSFNATGFAGDRVTLRFMAKSSANLAVGGYCKAIVVLYNAGIKVGARQIDCGNVGTSWEPVHFSLAAPANFTSVKVRFFFNKPVGTMWFDGASLIWAR